MQIWLKLFGLLSLILLIPVGLINGFELTGVQLVLGLVLWIAIATYVSDRFLSQVIQTIIYETKTPINTDNRETQAAITPFNSTALAIKHLKTTLQQASTNLDDVKRQLDQARDQLISSERIKDQMKKELEVGRNIQLNMLTLTFPNFPKRKDIELDAFLQPAKELGGDFYDFYIFRDHESYLFEQNTCCFYIGDVSGKGVPAALFMAVLKTLMKAQADLTLSPAKILTHLNESLSKNNPDCMFATLFLGTLNLKTGDLLYTNAGHNPPYIRRHDGTLEKLTQRHGAAIGLIEGITYSEGRTTLAYGDIFFSYTDGVTEAMDAHQALFSDEKLLDLLTSGDYHSAKDVVRLVSESVKAFQDQAEQSDDITMLAFQFLGHPEANSKASELVIKDDVLSSLRGEWQ